jgi:hypothetical protein
MLNFGQRSHKINPRNSCPGCELQSRWNGDGRLALIWRGFGLDDRAGATVSTTTERLDERTIVDYLLFREVPVMDLPISLFVEIPETLHQSLATFLDTRPEWDQDRVFSAAISLFLLQNRLPNQGSDRQAARIYLDALFGANPDYSSSAS